MDDTTLARDPAPVIPVPDRIDRPSRCRSPARRPPSNSARACRRRRKADGRKIHGHGGRQSRDHRPGHRNRRAAERRPAAIVPQDRAARPGRRNPRRRPTVRDASSAASPNIRTSATAPCCSPSASCAWSMAAPTPTMPISATCSRTPIDRRAHRHRSSGEPAFRHRSAPPASASRAASPSSCRRFSKRALTCASSWSTRTTNTAAASATRRRCSRRETCGCRSGCSISRRRSTPSSAAAPASRRKSRSSPTSFRWPRPPICNTAPAPTNAR